MVIGLFRFLVLVILAYVVFLFVRIWRAMKRGRGRAVPPRSIRGVMVKDEMCGTYIPKEEAVREVRDGREHFFCSEGCRKKFLNS